MQPLNDDELHDLLRTWEVPPAPPYLERRIFDKPRKASLYRWLLTGSIRVPVPAVLVLVLLLSTISYVLPRLRQPQPAPSGALRLSDFRPVPEVRLRIIRRTYENN
jgi:hypothetical protein